jgi:tRNA dimethylallyltransferase
VKRDHRAYARRQLTWMRKMPGVELIDRTGRDDASVAEQIVAVLAEEADREAEEAIE